MQQRNTPPVDARYWAAISIASVFGANLGDFVSNDLHLGHWRGLLPLAALLMTVLRLERRSAGGSEAWYWAAIVIIRTAATNLADLGTHDLRLGYAGVSLVLAVLLGVVVRASGAGAAPSGLPRTNAWYWVGMLVAGTLGTAAGDGLVHGGLGLPVATMVSTLLVAAALGWRAAAAVRIVAFYWLAIVLVRTAGTNLGDLTAHAVGLAASTVAFGALLIGTLLLWRTASTAEAGAD